MSSTDIERLENDLRAELEQIENHLFGGKDEGGTASSGAGSPFRARASPGSLSALEQAEADGEKEGAFVRCYQYE
jgi:hypothetical protein